MVDFGEFFSSQNLHSGSLSTIIKIAIGVIVLVVFISLLSKWGAGHSKRHSHAVVVQARNFVQKAAKMSVRAKQDTNTLFSLIDTTYGLAYANAARNILPAKEINNIENIDLEELIIFLEDKQNDLVKQLGVDCPTVRPDSEYAVYSNYLA